AGAEVVVVGAGAAVEDDGQGPRADAELEEGDAPYLHGATGKGARDKATRGKGVEGDKCQACTFLLLPPCPLSLLPCPCFTTAPPALPRRGAPPPPRPRRRGRGRRCPRRPGRARWHHGGSGRRARPSSRGCRRGSSPAR